MCLNRAGVGDPSRDIDAPRSNGPTSNRFACLLAKARGTAEATGTYSSQDTRNKITQEFQRRCDGKTPYDWQLDVTEALLLKLDCIAIAGTGAGKTMPFVMPLFADITGKRMMIVCSPLTALQTDQVSICC